MSAFTEAEIDELITEHKNAIKAVLSGQQYSLDTSGSRISVTRASLGMIQRGLDYWVNEKRKLGYGESDIVSIEGRR